MSQDYFASKGKMPAQKQDDQRGQDDAGNSATGRPGDYGYMTVGSGGPSQNAARLQQMLDDDSGYGGSAAGSSSSKLPLGSPRTDPSLSRDEIMSRQVAANMNATEIQEQQTAANSQLIYNKQRVALGRSINRVVELLGDLQEMNGTWPAHYPAVQAPDVGEAHSDRSSSRPNIHHSYSTLAEPTSPPPAHRSSLRRSMTSNNDREPSTAESSKDAESKSSPEAPRLVSPQIAQEFSILKIDLKLGSLNHTQLVHSLEKGSIASLLDGKIRSSLKHLQSLRERIEDTSSKVLVTGDLNAGKSTFCNALLRRKLLPEDQQPCTSLFCEVLDSRENSGIEEVHAVKLDTAYDRRDETTYDVYPLEGLEDLVVDNTNYMQCKVYVKDNRSIDQSLLNNGVVDIALIDAPGLNSDTTKTTALFARQEEIDVVVFVVSAANHFTQSAKEFIWAAAAEKAYIFMVVNGFDGIRDQERCKRLVLDQVNGLSPRTFKESSELVHFVSSNVIPTSPPSGGPGGGGGDDPGDDPKGKGKEKEKVQDFERLERSLRRFVLEKRARSKLAPARTYLLNILDDLNRLANANVDVAQQEFDRVVRELKELEPQLESSKNAKSEVSNEIENLTEDTCRDVYEDTRACLNSAILHSGDGNLGVPYPGIFSAFDYAEDIKEAMLSEVSAAVAACEEKARTRTVGGVDTIKQLGLLHLGNEYTDLNFRPDVMFRRRRDAIAKQIDVPTELVDFLDWSTLMHNQEKMAGTGMALTVATAVGGQVFGGMSWMNHAMTASRILGNDNLRKLILPGLALAGKSANPLHPVDC